jgi:voltage-gated potassium channel
MYLIVQILKQFSSTLRRENLHRVAILVLAMIVLASVFFWYFEDKLGFPDALWWTIVTLTTVGYGDISPTTAGGRIVGVILMVFGIGFLGVLTATFASIFIENKIMENRGMKAATVQKHIVICGWNYNGPDIVAELRADQKSKDIPIVVIAQLNDKPLNDSKLQFIRGDVQTDVLEKANVKTAQAVIMLSDDKLDPSVSDAKTIHPSTRMYTSVLNCSMQKTLNTAKGQMLTKSLLSANWARIFWCRLPWITELHE